MQVLTANACTSLVVGQILTTNPRTPLQQFRSTILPQTHGVLGLRCLLQRVGAELLRTSMASSIFLVEKQSNTQMRLTEFLPTFPSIIPFQTNGPRPHLYQPASMACILLLIWFGSKSLLLPAVCKKEACLQMQSKSLSGIQPHQKLLCSLKRTIWL